MNLTEKFEAKQAELARLEQRAAFLREQLAEAEQLRLQLVGQLVLLQELYAEQEQARQQALEHTAQQAAGQVEKIIDRVQRGKPKREEVSADGRDHT